MYRSFLRYTYVPNAGRWKTNKSLVDVVSTVDLANHDHCGGDQCADVPQLKKKKKKKVNASSSSTTGDDDDYDHMWPFLL